MVDRLVNSAANEQRIKMVESCFGSAGQPLAIPGRVLIGEGVLTKMCRKKPKPRQFFLFNDILVYGNIVLNKKKYNKQHIIPLEEVKLEGVIDDGACAVYRNGWTICTASKSFAVYAATSTEKSEWMAHINKCVDDCLKKSEKKPVTEHAAVWVPDHEAPICMHCKKTPFGVIVRRHHCRKCGLVVCGACSNRKFLLPQQSSKPLRVCLTCYDTLSKSKSNLVVADGHGHLAYPVDDDSKLSGDTRGSLDSSQDEDSDDDVPMQGDMVNEQPTFYDPVENPKYIHPPFVPRS